MDLSLVIPLRDEEESLPELCAWIKRVVDEHNYTYEIILIDDGSEDKSWEVIEMLRTADPHIKGIKFQRNSGKSAALTEGFKAAPGEVVITM
ncbi:MAG: glycosyltransferase, partial [Flavitalea sp.]